MKRSESDEKLTQALVTAAGAAFASLKETTREQFYFYVMVFDEGMHPYISAWSREALERSMAEQEIAGEDKSWWKWSAADSPYAAYGYDEYFGEVDRLLEERAGELSEDELYGGEWKARMDLMEEAMRRLDASGSFGTGKEREQVVINVEQAPPDSESGEAQRALRLNPPFGPLSEYLETCEDEE